MANNIKKSDKRQKVYAWAKAHMLYVYKELTAKECADRVGVTEKTLGCWIKAGNWKEEKNRAISDRSLREGNYLVISKTILNKLKLFLDTEHPEISAKIIQHLDDFVLDLLISRKIR
ncbi:hypothetical protein [Sphingobacterium siyangense]|uniref:Uncharacterized protein n=1 Tax=Sphingobacterium siyangense TaxID=459529 RepID=A0A562M8P8_9SPHI|nr:hypothetical protein [Sphingobacterium siyangense]TWI16307.1 hypothetical protein IQ31_04462 [Sphingobacterium siyangense]